MPDRPGGNVTLYDLLVGVDPNVRGSVVVNASDLPLGGQHPSGTGPDYQSINMVRARGATWSQL